jgi:hypothetical protein
MIKFDEFLRNQLLKTDGPLNGVIFALVFTNQKPNFVKTH